MVDPGTLGAIAAVGVPLLGYLHRTDKRAGKAVRLLQGEEEVEGDGVIPRLREVEQRSVEHRVAIERAEEIEVPDLDDDAVIADGGPEVDGAD